MAAVWNLLLSQRIFSNLSYRWREREKVRGGRRREERRGGREGGEREEGGRREEGGEKEGGREGGRDGQRGEGGREGGRSDRGQALIQWSHTLACCVKSSCGIDGLAEVHGLFL